MQKQKPKKEMYEAYAKKASEFSDRKFDNTTIIKDILSHRASIAKLLGFNNYAELSIDRKMANSPDEVCSFKRLNQQSETIRFKRS